MIIVENVNHYCVSVADLEKSIEFYKEIFGFEILEKISGADNATIQLGSIDLRLEQKDISDFKSENYICFYVDEDDFDDAIDELNENDIDIIFGPENVGHGRKAIFTDLDGNRLAITSYTGR